MQHDAAFHQCLHCKDKKDIQTKEYNIFENHTLTHLDMYNDLSQVCCIKLEGGIHKCTKSLTNHQLSIPWQWNISTREVVTNIRLAVYIKTSRFITWFISMFISILSYHCNCKHSSGIYWEKNKVDTHSFNNVVGISGIASLSLSQRGNSNI